MITHEAAHLVGCPEERILSVVDRVVGSGGQRRCMVHSVGEDGRAIMTVLLRPRPTRRWRIGMTVLLPPTAGRK